MTAAQTPDVPAATATHGGFALPDRHGRRLVLTADLPNPERLNTALCSGSRRIPVRFSGPQAAREADTGRQTPGNFDNLAGSLFILAGRVDPAAVCFLASDSLLAGSIPLDIAAPDGAGACLERRRLAAVRQRQVSHCWPLARLGPRAHVALLEFERRGAQALASLVVADGATTLFADYPAESSGQGQDLWRVDDGGTLSPEGWKLVAAVQRRRSFVLVVSWAGSEGQSLSLWTSGEGTQLTQIISDYWYQVPL